MFETLSGLTMPLFIKAKKEFCITLISFTSLSVQNISETFD